jgi:hypothetical protein
MMHQLRRYAAELRFGLQDRLATLIALGAVQGAILEIDRYWFEAYLWDREPWHPWRLIDPFHANRLFFAPIEWDFSYRPPTWHHHCKVKGYAGDSSPVIIRVILQPGTQRPPGTDENVYPGTFEGHPIVYETRAQLEAITSVGVGWMRRIGETFARLAFGLERDGVSVDHGASVGRAGEHPTAGTLGGYLRNPVSDQTFLVSCAHVLGQSGTDVYTPGPYEDRGMDFLGVVRFAAIPAISPPGYRCSGRANPNADCLDVAIAEIVPGAPGVIKLRPQAKVETVRLAESMTPFQPVSFAGKVSGSVPAYLGGCTIWHSIAFPDGMRCFGDIFEIVAPEGWARPLARHGDSQGHCITLSRKKRHFRLAARTLSR